MSELTNTLQAVLDRINKKEKEIESLAKFIPHLEELVVILKQMTGEAVAGSVPPMTPPAPLVAVETPPSPPPEPAPLPQPPPQVAAQKVLTPEEELKKLTALLNSKNWPHAVSPDLIVNDESENDKFERAEGIIEIVLPQTREINVLDIGCGEGHFVVKAAEKGYHKVVGHDLNKPEKTNFEWEKLDGNKLLTTSWDEVVKNGPYNVVILFDVLDHIKGKSSVDLLKKTKTVLAPEGTIFARCHPWCSRHGAHLYKKINKAWIQLVFTEEELAKMGYEIEQPHARVIKPRAVYEALFAESGLRVTNLDTDRTAVEQFFANTPVVRDRIINACKESVQSFPQFQMEQSFLDYTLKAG